MYAGELSARLRRDVVINADDFGRNEAINKAVLLSFEQGLVTSASLMPNAPGFEEACRIVQRFELHAKIGLHIVLSAGEPITREMRMERRFCTNDGTFRPNPKAREFRWLSSNERQSLLQEVEAQILKMKGKGLEPKHIDSHHHVHGIPSFAAVIIPLVRKYRIKSVRCLVNVQPPWGVGKRLYASIYNLILGQLNLARTARFGSIYNFLAYAKKHGRLPRGGSYEIMVHPILGANSTVLEAQTGKALAALLSELKELS